MKKLLFYSVVIALNSLTISNVAAQTNQNSNTPQFLWTSEEVKSGKVAEKNAFNLGLTSDEFKVGDKVRVTFGSYKVTLSGLTPGTTFSKWSCKVKLLNKNGSKWVSVVADTNDRINQSFSGVNSNPSDSITNYSFVITVPKSKRITFAVEPDKWHFEDIKGPDKPMFLKGYPTWITTVRGIKIEKVN